MLMPKNDNFKPAELMPDGMHPAICYIFADLGYHEVTFEGKTSVVRKIVYAWEFPGTLREDGTPFVKSQEYKANLWPGTKGGLKGNPSALYNLLNSWVGLSPADVDGFDPASVVGKPCLINIVHSADKKDPKKFYANIASVTPPIQGMPIPTGVNPSVVYDPTADASASKEAYDKLPKWMQEKIASALKDGDPGKPGIADEDIPF